MDSFIVNIESVCRVGLKVQRKGSPESFTYFHCIQIMRGVQEVTSFIRIMSALLDTNLLREEVEKQGNSDLMVIRFQLKVNNLHSYL